MSPSPAHGPPLALRALELGIVEGQARHLCAAPLLQAVERADPERRARFRVLDGAPRERDALAEGR